MSARDRIVEAAAQGGWTTWAKGSDDWATEWRKGRRHVRVNFDTKGRVTHASTHRRSITGADRAQQVVDVMTGAAR